VIAACKAFIKSKLLDLGLDEKRIRLQLKRGSRYEVPQSAVVLVNTDVFEKLGGRAALEVLGNQAAETVEELRIYENRYLRRLVLEISIHGATEDWVNEVVERLAATMERRLVVTDPVLGREVLVDVTVLRGEWDDVEALLPNVVTGQLFVLFERPYIHAQQAPFYMDVPLGEAELNLEE